MAKEVAFCAWCGASAGYEFLGGACSTCYPYRFEVPVVIDDGSRLFIAILIDELGTVLEVAGPLAQEYYNSIEICE